MDKKKKLRLILTVAIAVVTPLVFGFGWRSAGPRFVTSEVTRGPITRAVSATGTLNPVVTVQVGSHVSGLISATYVDFNSPVRAGQLIAKIDPRPFEIQVAQARAVLANSKAQFRKDQAEMSYKKLRYERESRLLRQGAVSEDAVDNDLSAYQQMMAQAELDQAAIMQQEAALRAAEINLGYTNIVSPVDGTVVSRTVDVGQTVTASFQTPTLFLIARRLTEMQVDTNVSESDIGEVRVGQTATFKVDAYPDREFEGRVSQVRQAPITVQNVVTYDVVVSIGNPELLLKPGMTANLSIITARRDDVVRVPILALRFVPDRSKRHAGVVNDPIDTNGHLPRSATVWVRRAGSLMPVTITTGLDDRNWVEVRSGNLHPGEKAVVDEIAQPKAKSGFKLARLFR
jgi:HlyD family secretion protein